MKIISAEACNFRSYFQFKWNLPSFGLHLIDGENLDSGRNNMTGKTTLTDSIFWCYFGYLPKWNGPKGGNADAVIKRGEKKCLVQTMTHNMGKQIFIRRERPNKLYVEVDGIELHGKSTDLDQRIIELIGMTPEQFLTAVYISQDRKQSFFTMGELERTTLLSQISKVDNINKAMEKARASKSSLEMDITRAESYASGLEFQMRSLPTEILARTNDLTAKKAQLDAGLDKLYSLERDNKVRAEAYEHEFEKKNEQAIKEFNQKQSELMTLISESETELAVKEIQVGQAPRVELEYTQRIEELKSQIARIEKDNQESIRQEGRNNQAKAALQNLADQIESSQRGSCDHCGQDLPNHMIDKHIEELLVQASKWEKALVEVKPIIDVSPLKNQLTDALQAYAQRKAELESGPSKLMSEILLIKKTLDLQRQNLFALDQNHRRDIREIQAMKANSMRELDSMRGSELMRVENLRTQVSSAEFSLSQTKRQEENLKSEIDTKKIQIYSLQKQLDEALDLIDLFKGFRQVCFEDLIARISDRAGDLLSIMTDGIYSTRIDQIGETSKGEMKMVLKPMITKGGQDVPLDDLSGGARRTVMLAYDVAVAEAVGDSNVLFLDEALDGLDTIGKTEALKLLEEVSRNRAVMVIDHSSEIKSAFSNIIKVVFKDGTSHLESNGAA